MLKHSSINLANIKTMKPIYKYLKMYQLDFSKKRIKIRKIKMQSRLKINFLILKFVQIKIKISHKLERKMKLNKIFNN